MTIRKRNIRETNHIKWHRVSSGRAKNSKSESENVILCYSLINNIKYNIYIYNNNVTACYCAWIVACHVVLPIFSLFNLQFCKIRLHFSYIPLPSLFSSHCAKIPVLPFWCVMRAICGILLILLAFFLPKRLPKLAKPLVKMASHWF